MLIDTHAHVNFRAFKDDAEATLRRSLDNGTWVINIGSQIDTSRQAVELANKFPPHPALSLEGEGKGRGGGVYAVVGLHPEHTHSQYVDEEESHFLTREENFDYNSYRELASNPKVVGIGECGLDYYRLLIDGEGSPLPEGNPLIEAIKQKQKETFHQQIKLAKELDKVLVVHSRSSKGTDDACLDILEILKSETFTPSLTLPTRGREQKKYSSPQSGGGEVGGIRFVLHSYTGSPEVLQKFLDLGGYVSFNGIITFDKTGNMEKLVKMAPLDKILLETDCPYLAPVPMRGKRNEPSFVKYIAEKLAEIKGISFAEIAEITTKNAKKLFKLPSFQEEEGKE